MKYLLFYIFAFCVTFCVSAKLPSSFKKCNRKQSDFDDCLTKAIDDAVHSLNKPIKEVGLRSVEPLEIPSITISAGKGPVGFDQIYNNMKLHGFTKSSLKSAKMDFNSKILQLHFVVPEIDMVFDYDFNGKILVLPIVGKGPGVIKIFDLKFDFEFVFKEYEKDGVKYFKIDKSSLKMTPKLLTFKLDNLFDGDERLGKPVNDALNDNWQEVYADVQEQYEEAFRQIFTAMFEDLLDRVSVVDLFGD